MINTILVEDDLYIQKHFAERLKSNEIFRLVGVYRDAFEAEKNCNCSIQLILMDVQTQHKHSAQIFHLCFEKRLLQKQYPECYFS